MEKIIDRTIIKFGFYGFFKNLRFFEPFIYLYFLSIGLTFFQIGLLISIRELSIYICEIPTGIIADVGGRKKAILICFILYVISFLLYYLSQSFWLLAVASIVFGLGEAFRLGTHKAIIFDYLDRRGISDKKAEVYGFTRSISLLGSALSAIIAALLLVWSRDYHLIFLFSIIPYLMAFLLVLTYPPDRGSRLLCKEIIPLIVDHTKKSSVSLRSVKNLQLCLVNSAVFDGVFKGTIDYAQPIVRSLVLTYPLLLFIDNPHTRETLLIGLFYLVINIVGALSSRWAHYLNHHFSSLDRPLNVLFLSQAVLLLLISLVLEVHLLPLFIFFLLLYVNSNLRRPLLLSYLVQEIQPEQRATMLSIESQLKSLTLIILAPILGRIVDLFSIRSMFLSLSLVLLLLYLTMLRFRSLKNMKTFQKIDG